MKNALIISKDGWDTLPVKCPPNLVKGVKKACIDADIVPSQLLISLLNMVACGDVKLTPNPKCRSYSPNLYMKVVDLEGDFDVARVRISTLDGVAINTTPLSNTDL